MRKSIWSYALVSLLIIGVFPVFGIAQSGDKADYADIKKVFKSFAEMMENFVEKMDSASEADEIAKTLNKFSDGMEKMVPQINEINAKHPEFQDESTHPEELKPLMERIIADFQALMKSYGKVMENIEAPAVKEADSRFQEVMAGLK